MLIIKQNEQTKPIRYELLVAKPITAAPVFISDRVSKAIDRVLEKHFTNRNELFSKRRDKPIVSARRDLMKIMYHEMNWSVHRIANYFKMDRTTVQYHIGLCEKSKVKYGAFQVD
jgi:chromosomal replication initiation ATPase DnaA